MTEEHYHNKFLDEFKKVNEAADKNERSKLFRKAFKKAVRNEGFKAGMGNSKPRVVASDARYFKDILEKKGDVEKVEWIGNAMGKASHYLHDGEKNGDIILAYDGAVIFEALGAADRPYIVEGLIKAYKNALAKNYTEGRKYREVVEKFIERHGEAASKRHKGLKAKLSAATAIIGFAGSLLYSASQITGNIIGLHSSLFNFSGLLFFSIGLIGSIFYFKYN